MAQGPRESLSREFGGRVGKREGEGQQGPLRADPTSALTHLCALSLCVSVWETETIGKRSPGENRLLTTCPSAHPAGAQLWLLGMGGGGVKGFPGTRVSPPSSPLLPPAPDYLRGGCTWKVQPLASVLMGFFGRTRPSPWGGVRKQAHQMRKCRPECVCEPAQMPVSPSGCRVGVFSSHEDRRDLRMQHAGRVMSRSREASWRRWHVCCWTLETGFENVEGKWRFSASRGVGMGGGGNKESGERETKV